MRSRLFVVLILIVPVMVAACLLVTGSTSGYTQAAPEGGCESAEDCTEGGIAQICCFGATGSACQVGPCGTQAAQLCNKSGECADVACIPQSCSLGTTELSVKACGIIHIEPIVCTEN